MNLTAFGCTAIVLLVLGGCAGSEEALQEQAQKISDYERQVEELRTENTTLRQRIVKLEQDTRTLQARLSESEAKVVMERERAERAEAEVVARKIQPTAASKGAAISPTAGKGGYDDALAAAFAKRYDEAIAKFEALLNTIGDDFADNCHYWIGECRYAKKQYREAIKQFEAVMKYTKSEKLADAHFMMAQSYERLGDTAKAKEHYQTVVKDYPTSAHVALAKQRAGKM